MVGDDFLKDVNGAFLAGMRSCWIDLKMRKTPLSDAGKGWILSSSGTLGCLSPFFFARKAEMVHTVFFRSARSVSNRPEIPVPCPQEDKDWRFVGGMSIRPVQVDLSPHFWQGVKSPFKI